MITPHTWLSKADKIHYPDKLIFDLDPEKRSFQDVCYLASLIKQALESCKLKPFVMTTGSKGLHVVTHIDRKKDFVEVKDFARKISEIIIEHEPNLCTLEVRKEKRGNKIFIDTLRNQFTAISVCPYGIRSIEGAPVATPLYWEEIKDKKLKSTSYNIYNVFDKLKADGDPWKNFFKTKSSLPDLE